MSFYMDVRDRLEAAGFSFYHDGAAGDRRAYWWCWCGPLGEWDVENGYDCPSEEAAVLGAVDVLIYYAVGAYRELEAE